MRSLSVTVSAAVTGLVVLGSTQPAFANPSATGFAHSESFGVRHEGPGVVIGPVPYVGFPLGPSSATLPDVTGVAQGRAGGDLAKKNAWAWSSSRKVNLVLPGQLTFRADEVGTLCKVVGRKASGAGLTTGGVVGIGSALTALPANPKPNTRVDVPGLDRVIVNRQHRTADGAMTVVAAEIWQKPEPAPALPGAKPAPGKPAESAAPDRGHLQVGVATCSPAR